MPYFKYDMVLLFTVATIDPSFELFNRKLVDKNLSENLGKNEMMGCFPCNEWWNFFSCPPFLFINSWLNVVKHQTNFWFHFFIMKLLVFYL